jgi:hypothetical protein
VRLVQALDISAKAGQDSFGDLDLVLAAHDRGQQFGQAAGERVRAHPAGGLVPQGQQFYF